MEEQKGLNLENFVAESIIKVSPLEPCLIWVALSEKNNEETSYKSVGIPGFYDHASKKFIALDGGKIKINGFNEKLEEYIKGLEKQTPSIVEGNINGTN